MSEVDKFFEGLPSEDKTEQQIFENENPKEEPKAPEEGENSTLKNRRERRLEEKWQKEREMSIALNEQVKYLSDRVKSLDEQQRYVEEHKGEIDPRLLRAFGTTEEGKELSKIFQDILKDTAEQAKAKALEEWQNSQSEVSEAVERERKENEDYIQVQLEALEEEHGIDLTSNAPVATKARKEFLGLIEKLSPKDSSGAIKEYADFDTAFEIYKGSQKAEPSRAKELAARSMQTSAPAGQPAPTGRMTFDRAEQEINKLFNN